MQIFSYPNKFFTTSEVTTKVCWYCIRPESTKWFKMYDIFSIIIDSTLKIRKRLVEMKFSTLVEQLLPDCHRKLNYFNLTNLIIDLAVKFFFS